MYNAPPNYQPGYQPSYQPYTPPPRKSSNALLYGLGGCGLILVLLAVFGGLAVQRFMKGGLQKVVRQAQASEYCGQTLFQVRSALDAYRKAHNGSYPAALSELVPQYLTDKSALTCGNEGQDVMKMEYAPPRSNATGDTAVVSYVSDASPFMSFNSRRHGNRSGKITMINSVRLLKDGRIVTDSITRTEMSEATAASGKSGSAPSGDETSGSSE